jgi:hypothetical protein
MHACPRLSLSTHHTVPGPAPPDLRTLPPLSAPPPATGDGWPPRACLAQQRSAPAMPDTGPRLCRTVDCVLLCDPPPTGERARPVGPHVSRLFCDRHLCTECLLHSRLPLPRHRCLLRPQPVRGEAACPDVDFLIRQMRARLFRITNNGILISSGSFTCYYVVQSFLWKLYCPIICCYLMLSAYRKF